MQDKWNERSMSLEGQAHYSSAKVKDKQTRLSMDKSFGVKSSNGIIDC